MVHSNKTVNILICYGLHIDPQSIGPLPFAHPSDLSNKAALYLTSFQPSPRGTLMQDEMRLELDHLGCG
jgi:hypothetical protein